MQFNLRAAGGTADEMRIEHIRRVFGEDTRADFAERELTSYLSPLNRFKRERATFFTDSTANGRIL
jgi:hypothetical protein